MVTITDRQGSTTIQHRIRLKLLDHSGGEATLVESQSRLLGLLQRMPLAALRQLHPVPPCPRFQACSGRPTPPVSTGCWFLCSPVKVGSRGGFVSLLGPEADWSLLPWWLSAVVSPGCGPVSTPLLQQLQRESEQRASLPSWSRTQRSTITRVRLQNCACHLGTRALRTQRARRNPGCRAQTDLPQGGPSPRLSPWR